jgi:hypothetical protein
LQPDILLSGEWRTEKIHLRKRIQTKADVIAFGWLSIATDSMRLGFHDGNKFFVNDEFAGTYITQLNDSLKLTLLKSEEVNYHIRVLNPKNVALTNKEFTISLKKISE